MSRSIPAKHSVTLSDNERGLRDTENGKLVFTEYRGRQCALLLKGGRALAAAFFSQNTGSAIGAIYIGRIKNIARNIDACFVEIGEGEICFLPLKKAATPFLTNRTYDGRLLEGDQILVQVERDAQKTKQASVTAQISLANDYFAFVLGFSKLGFSTKLCKEKKETIAELFAEQGITVDGHLHLDNESNVKLPAIGAIVRTKVGELTDTGEVLTQFHRISEEFLKLFQTASTRSCFSCLLEAPLPWEAVLHNLATPEEYHEIVTDDVDLYQDLLPYCAEHLSGKELRLYQDNTLTLANLYSLETKLDTALKPKVWLKSGGYLIIEPTEALTVIDVNSGKNETGRGTEALRRLNHEAAEEIALQLRLRNLSGIILVDFINMENKESGQELLEHLRELVRADKVPTFVVDITPLGLVEITRKKQNRPLTEQFQEG